MSQVTLGPTRVIDGPVPVPPRYSLLVNATIIEDPDYHWMAGGAVYPYPQLDDGSTHNPCLGGTYGEKITGGTLPGPEFGAFTAYVSETCTARGIGDDTEFQNRAVTALVALEAALVEKEFSEGIAMPSNPYLGDTEADIIVGSPLAPVEAMARLEKAIAATGKMGVIHADPGTTTAWAAAVVIEREGNQLRTIANGTPVVSGYGYVGMAPLGQSTPVDADKGWAYATGPVQIRRSEIQMVPGSLKEALDRLSNTVTYRAERHYLVDWDTELQAAVLVDR